jgi:hypothetical protein
MKTTVILHGEQKKIPINLYGLAQKTNTSQRPRKKLKKIMLEMCGWI